MLSYLGEVSVGGITPLSVSCSAALVAAIEVDLTALALLIVNLNANPPSLTADASAIAALIVQLQLGISVDLPSADFQALAVADAIATLSAELAIPLSFELLLGGGAGIYAYGYHGAANAFGRSVTDALSVNWPDGTGSDVQSNALIMATTQDAVWSDMLAFFGVIPPSLPPGLTYVAQCNIGTLCPACVTACVPIIADLKARLAGLIELAVKLSLHPPKFSVSLTLAIQLLADLQAAIELNLPGLAFQLEALAALVAALEAKLALLAKLSLTLGGAAGVFVYEYSGLGRDMGAQISAALTTGWPDGTSATATSNAIIAGVNIPAVWAVVRTFFGIL